MASFDHLYHTMNAVQLGQPLPPKTVRALEEWIGRKKKGDRRQAVSGLLALLDSLCPSGLLQEKGLQAAAQKAAQDHYSDGLDLADLFGIGADRELFARKYRQLMLSDPDMPAAMENPQGSLPLYELLFYYRDRADYIRWLSTTAGITGFSSEKTVFGFRNPSALRGKTDVIDVVLRNREQIVFLCGSGCVSDAPRSFGIRMTGDSADPLLRYTLEYTGPEYEKTRFRQFVLLFAGVLHRILDSPAVNTDNGLAEEEEEINALIAGGAQVYLGIAGPRSFPRKAEYNGLANRLNREAERLQSRSADITAVYRSLSEKLKERNIDPDEVFPAGLRGLVLPGGVNLQVCPAVMGYQ
ncbi:MAG: hypothetical protein IK083_09150 [Abditibacteriota bacterium]|nr:hypothetical protein [Abditibacteriota bacterium]